MPKTSEERRRVNAPEAPIDKINPAEVSDRFAGLVEPPAADDTWHAIARRWYDSLAQSGQSVFYEPSDWATAYLLAESLSRDLKPQFVGVGGEEGTPIFQAIPLKGASLGAYLKAMTSLLVTEGDRRRAAIELKRAQADAGADAEVVSITSTRHRRLSS